MSQAKENIESVINELDQQAKSATNKLGGLRADISALIREEAALGYSAICLLKRIHANVNNAKLTDKVFREFVEHSISSKFVE